MSTSTFDLWRIRALTYAERLGFSPDSVNEAIGVLSAVFPSGWLEEMAEKKTLASPLPFREHPIGSALHVATETQVIEVLELVAYLKAISSSSAISLVADNLKAQYGSTLLQLAFAHRFIQAGATDMVLEPVVSDGRVGDLAFKVGERGYIAECYIPRLSQAKSSREEAHWLTQQVMEAISDEHVVFSVAVELHELLTAQGRKELVRSIRDLADQIKQDVRNSSEHSEPLLRVLQPGTVSIGTSFRVGPDDQSILVLHQDFPVPRDDQPSVFVRVQQVRKSQALRAQNPIIRGEYGTHVAIWFSPEERRLNTLVAELGGPLVRLGKKLKRKLAQTKLNPDWHRLLIVESWVTDELDRAPEKEISKLRRQIFEEHSGVAGVLLVRRHWSQQLQRSIYHSRILVPDKPDLNFQEWIERVCSDALTRGYP